MDYSNIIPSSYPISFLLFFEKSRALSLHFFLFHVAGFPFSLQILAVHVPGGVLSFFIFLIGAHAPALFQIHLFAEIFLLSPC